LGHRGLGVGGQLGEHPGVEVGRHPRRDPSVLLLHLLSHQAPRGRLLLLVLHLLRRRLMLMLMLMLMLVGLLLVLVLVLVLVGLRLVGRLGHPGPLGAPARPLITATALSAHLRRAGHHGGPLAGGGGHGGHSLLVGVAEAVGGGGRVALGGRPLRDSNGVHRPSGPPLQLEGIVDLDGGEEAGGHGHHAHVLVRGVRGGGAAAKAEAAAHEGRARDHPSAAALLACWGHHQLLGVRRQGGREVSVLLGRRRRWLVKGHL